MIAIKAKGRVLFVSLGDVSRSRLRAIMYGCSGIGLLSPARGNFKGAGKAEAVRFMWIHRSELANTMFVAEIKPYSTGKRGLRVEGGKEYAVTSAYKKDFKPLTEFGSATVRPSRNSGLNPSGAHPR